MINRKLLIAIMVVSFIVYSLLIACVGGFGTSIQATLVPICLVGLKWLGIIVGYVVAVLFPIRIFNALKRNEERAKLQDLMEKAEQKEAEKNKDALRQRAVEEAILKSYYKEDDDV